jgi:ribA/ribD-fused uncharacterized protein
MKLSEKTKTNSEKGPGNWWKKSVNLVPNDPLPVPAPAPNFAQQTEGEANSAHRNDSENARPIRFRGARSSFSNFYASPLTVWGMNFPTNEHAYNYRKAMEMGKRESAEKIRHAATARDAQLIARNDIIADARWKTMKRSVMYELLERKVEQCATFREDLIASQDRLLIEDTAHDYWGRGREGNGQNVLGRLLMTLRESVAKTSAATRYARSSSQNRHSYPVRGEQQQRCFNCGEKSHNVRTCRHSGPIECYSCHRHGHKQKNCPSRRY